MKSAILFSMTALALSASAYGQHPPASRFGVIEIEDDDQFTHRLLFNRKEIFQYEGLSIDLFDVLQGTGLDYLIIVTNSGGIACPFQVVINTNRVSTKSVRSLAHAVSRAPRDWSTAE